MGRKDGMTEGRTKQTLNAPLPFYGGGIKSTFDSCEVTSNQIDNFKTCLSLSCRVNILNFDVLITV